MPDARQEGAPGNGDALYNYLTAQQGQGFVYIEDRPAVAAGAVGIDLQGEHVVADGRGGWVRGCPCMACRRHRAEEPVQAAQRAVANIQTLQAERARNRATAPQKAQQLARGFLTPEQLASIDAFSYFEVVSNKGNRWRIDTNVGISGNVHRLDKAGRVQGSWCGYPFDRTGGGLPAWDVFLGQAFALETDEDYFTGTAIGSGGWDF